MMVTDDEFEAGGEKALLAGSGCGRCVWQSVIPNQSPLDCIASRDALGDEIDLDTYNPIALDSNVSDALIRGYTQAKDGKVKSLDWDLNDDEDWLVDINDVAPWDLDDTLE